MKLTIEINMDNAAFDPEPKDEVQRILRRLADSFDDWPGRNEFKLGLLDMNGNKVGKAEVH